MRRRVTPRSWSAPPPSAGQRRRPSPTAAAGASALLPGAGQLLVGRGRRGAALGSPPVLLAGSVIVTGSYLLLTEGTVGLLAALLRPGVLSAVLAANALLALARAFVAVDAWQLARYRRGRAGAVHVGGLLAVLALLVTLPHGAVALAGVRAHAVLDTVFVTTALPPVAVDRAPTTAPGPTREAAGSPEPEQRSRSADTPPVPHQAPDEQRTPPVDDTAPAPTPTPQRASRELLDGAARLSVLLLGSDAGPERSGTRIDAMVVASIDVDSGETALVSIARNLGDVPLSGVFAERLGDHFPDRLTGLYAAAARDPVLAAAFDDPGTAAHVNAAETLLGLRLHHVAQVDLAGFVDVVDALGGVEVDVAAPIQVRLSPPRDGEDWRAYDLPAGRQHLDGHHAHAYVRSRTGSDDYDRMRRQRCLLGALAAQADTTRLLRALPELTDVLTERVRTDLPVDRLPDLARLAGRIDVSEVRTLGLTPPAYTEGLRPGGYHRPDVDGIQAAVRDLITGEGPSPAGARDLAATCG